MTGVARGKGYLADLSKTGCKIVGSPLKTGSRGTLVIRLDDEQPSLCVAGFEVSWATGDSFGVRFPHLNGELRHRLQETGVTMCDVQRQQWYPYGFPIGI